MESFILFTVFYALFSVCLLFPPPGFVSSGLTFESLFSYFLGHGITSFIHYQIKRTVFTLMSHCSLPFVYILLSSYMFPEWTINKENILWHILVAFSLFPPTVCAFIIYSWHKGNWRNHPIARQLRNFVTEDVDINQITREIDSEYRSFNKVVIECNAVVKVIATDNWLIKISPYYLNIARQQDVSLEIISCSQYKNALGQLGMEYLSIDVKTNGAKVDNFQIRINSADFKELQEKLYRPINMGDIGIHLSMGDHFVEVFKRHVRENSAAVLPAEALDVCIGCMQTTPNVIILSPSCGDESGRERCTKCSCKPMWCVDCLGKWFAVTQDQERPDTWLSSKCVCPICRGRFCILDICPINPVDNLG